MLVGEESSIMPIWLVLVDVGLCESVNRYAYEFKD